MTIEPRELHLAFGQSVKLHVSFTPSPPHSAHYRWYIFVDPRAGSHGPGNGTLIDDQRAAKELVTTVPTVIYEAPSETHSAAPRGIDDVYCEVHLESHLLDTAQTIIAYGHATAG